METEPVPASASPSEEAATVAEVKPLDALKTEVAPFEEKGFPNRETEYRVIIHPRAYDAMMAHGQSNPKVELCGVLIGEVYKDADGPYLVVSDIIEGRSARERSAEVTFTHSTWEYIHQQVQEKYADRRIVGWYHMHPGFGIFLSEVDLFAHRNFFNASWQISLVIDPKVRKEGLFFWRNGEVVRARRWWIGNTAHWEPPERPVVSTAPGATPSHKEARPESVTGETAAGASHGGPSLYLVFFFFTVAACLLLAFLNLRAELRNAQLASEIATLRAVAGGQRQSGNDVYAKALAQRARELLEKGCRASDLRPMYEAILQLDAAHEAVYAMLLPELAALASPVRDRTAERDPAGSNTAGVGGTAGDGK